MKTDTSSLEHRSSHPLTRPTLEPGHNSKAENFLVLLELRIPAGELLRLPHGWSYGSSPKPDQRLLTHESNLQILVTETDSDETVDIYVMQMLLRLATR